MRSLRPLGSRKHSLRVLRQCTLSVLLCGVVSWGIACGDEQNKPVLSQVVLIADSMGLPIGIDDGDHFFELLIKNRDQIYPKWSRRSLSVLYPDVRVVRKAVLGASSAKMLSILQDVPNNPDGRSLVVIAVGLNDFFFMMTDPNAKKMKEAVKDLEVNLKQFVRHFHNKRRFPHGADIVILNYQDLTESSGFVAPFWPSGGFCGFWPRQDNDAAKIYRQMFSTLDDMLSSLSSEGDVMIADINTLLRGHGSWFWLRESPFYQKDDPSFWFTLDCIHFNERGHHAIRELIWGLLPEEITAPPSL